MGTATWDAVGYVVKIPTGMQNLALHPAVNREIFEVFVEDLTANSRKHFRNNRLSKSKIVSATLLIWIANYLKSYSVISNESNFPDEYCTVSTHCLTLETNQLIGYSLTLISKNVMVQLPTSASAVSRSLIWLVHLPSACQ